MASKLAYLSKYGGDVLTNDYGSGENENDDYDDVNKRRKKSKKKSKKKSRRGDEDHDDNDLRRKSALVSTLRDMDDLQPFLPGDNVGDEEEGPAVVEPAIVEGMLGLGEGGEFSTAASAVALAGDHSRSKSSHERRGLFEAVSMIENNGIAKNGGRSEVQLQYSGEAKINRRDHSRRARHDSVDSDDLPRTNNNHFSRADGKLGRRHRHDSESDMSNTLNDHRAKKKKQLHDELESEDKRRSIRSSESHRRRHDSDSNEDDEAEKRRKTLPRCRHDSTSEDDDRKAPPRRRHDSDSDDNEVSNRHAIADRRRISKKTEKRVQYDSVSYSDDGNIRKQHHRRHDSSSDESENRSSLKAAKMSSGHKSGLQKSEDFVRAEINIRKRQREELAQFNLGCGSNGVGETIHRDASGKKRTISSNYDEEQLRREEEEKVARQRRANKGTYQRMQEEIRLRELEEAANMTLARGIEDEQLEERKRSVIREGDPMAMHEWKKQQARQSKQSAINGDAAAMVHKPVYKGPQPKPNRYNIRPGYRWDGIDRGNGFEDRVLEMLHSKGRKKEEAYKWSAADM